MITLIILLLASHYLDRLIQSNPAWLTPKQQKLISLNFETPRKLFGDDWAFFRKTAYFIALCCAMVIIQGLFSPQAYLIVWQFGMTTFFPLSIIVTGFLVAKLLSH